MTEISCRPKARGVAGLIVLSLLSGIGFGAAGVLYACSPYAAYISHFAEETRTWGHVSTDDLEPIARCATSMQRIYKALKSYERSEGRLPVETGDRGFLAGKIDKYLGGTADLVCGADRSHGSCYGDESHPNSRTYFITKGVADQFGGQFPPLTPDSPILVCRHHPGVLLILRYDGRVEVAPRGKYSRIGVETVLDAM